LERVPSVGRRIRGGGDAGEYKRLHTEWGGCNWWGANSGGGGTICQRAKRDKGDPSTLPRKEKNEFMGFLPAKGRRNFKKGNLGDPPKKKAALS